MFSKTTSQNAGHWLHEDEIVGTPESPRTLTAKKHGVRPIHRSVMEDL